MPIFKNGTHINRCNDKKRKYLRISAGPQRGKYVHDLILEAQMIGEKQGLYMALGVIGPGCDDGCFDKINALIEGKRTRMRDDETAEHRNGNGLDCDPDNIGGPILRTHNTSLMRNK